MPDSEFGTILIAVLAFAIVMLNVFEIVLITKKKERKMFDKLLLSLAASDALVGVTAAALKISELLAAKKPIWLSSYTFASVYVLSTIFSIKNVLGITVDRFLAVRFPIKHRMVLSNSRANLIIIGLWISSLIALAMNSLMVFYCMPDMEKLITGASISLLAFGVVIAAVYSHIFHLVCKRSIVAAETRGDNSESKRRFSWFFSKGPSTAERSVLITGSLVVLFFIGCTYPFSVEYLIKRSWTQVSFASRLMIVMNSIFNPAIYFFKSVITERRHRAVTTEIELH